MRPTLVVDNTAGRATGDGWESGASLEQCASGRTLAMALAAYVNAARPDELAARTATAERVAHHFGVVPGWILYSLTGPARRALFPVDSPALRVVG